MYVLWQNQLVKREEVQIDIEDRGYQYGDGLYEVIRVYNGKCFMLEEHLDRFFLGAEKIFLTLSFSREELKAGLLELIQREQILMGKLYFQVTRGYTGPRNHALLHGEDSKSILTANLVECPRDTAKMKNGITTGFVTDKRWLHCDIKSLSLLGNVLALDEARQEGFDDAILVREGYVTEASAANLWMVKDGVLYTHPDDHLVLAGITKKGIKKVADKLGIPIVEKAFLKEALLTADEVFISGTIVELVPVISIDHQKVRNGKRGPLTHKLQQGYQQEFEKVCGQLD